MTMPTIRPYNVCKINGGIIVFEPSGAFFPKKPNPKHGYCKNQVRLKEKKPKINYLVGGFLEKKITLKSLLPDKLFQRIIMKLYS